MGDSHANTNNTICGVPKAHVTSIRATLWGPPRHNQQVHLNKDVEDDCGVPSLELGTATPHAFMAISDDVDTNGHGKIEDGIGVSLQADDCRGVMLIKWLVGSGDVDSTHTKLEGVSSRRGHDHDEGHDPFKQVRTDWSSKWLRGDPEFGIWENSLAVDSN